MGFSPSNVGLRGERITSMFGVSRPSTKNKYHIGIDISSSRRARAFRAGVYGTVVIPNGGRWGTVTVVPFHDQTSAVQYLHCSSINVSPNKLVAPWTNLGMTGTKAPPGSGITGYHLHLHVIDSGSQRLHPEWKFNYVDPVVWTISNPIIGHWSGRWSGADVDQDGDRYSWRSKVHWHITGDTIGSAVSMSMLEVNVYDHLSCQMQYGISADGSVTSRNDNYLKIDFPSGQCYVDGTCNVDATMEYQPASVKVVLQNSRKLRIYGIHEFDLRKSSRPPKEIDSLIAPQYAYDFSVPKTDTSRLPHRIHTPAALPAHSGIENILFSRQVTLDDVES